MFGVERRFVYYGYCVLNFLVLTLFLEALCQKSFEIRKSIFYQKKGAALLSGDRKASFQTLSGLYRNGRRTV